MIGMLYTLIPILIILYVRCITPRFIDNFGMRHEIQLILVPGAGLLLTLAALTTIDATFKNEHINAFLHLLNLFLFSTFAFYTTFICTVWVIHVNRDHIDASKRKPSSPTYNRENNRGNLETNNLQFTEDQIETVLEAVLKYEQGFCAFMAHVASVGSILDVYI